MRNDSLDELEQLPSLTIDGGEVAAHGHPPEPDGVEGVSRAGGNRLPWVLVAGLLAALAGLGWWSQQQLQRIEQQLVATQESFARISEDAAGRLKDISGKVVATESSVTSESEALKLRVKQLEGRLTQLLRQQQAGVEQLGSQGRQLQQLRGELQEQQGAAARLAAGLKQQQGAVAGLEARLKTLAEAQAALKTAQADSGRLEARVRSLGSEVAALKKQSPAQAIGRLEEDLLVLRSQMDNRPPAPTESRVELDAFRAQMTRNITTLQAQVQNLQQQIDAR